MITLEDRVTLAPGVSVQGDVVVDVARGLELPASPSALLVLGHADGRTVADVGAILRRHGASQGDRDALEFCAELNRRLLVNVWIRPTSLLRRRIAAAARGIVMSMPPRRVRSIPVGLAVSASALAAVVVPFALALGAWPLALGVCGGVVLHEMAHAVALHRVPRALVLYGFRPTLVHRRLGSARALAVAVSGPLAPALLALFVLSSWPGAALACAPLGAHALGLTVIAPDGRNACGLS